MTFWEVDILGVDISGVDILGVDILGVDIWEEPEMCTSGVGSHIYLHVIFYTLLDLNKFGCCWGLLWIADNN